MKQLFVIVLIFGLSSCAKMPWQKNEYNSQQASASPQDYLGKLRQRLIDNYANILFCYERYGTGQVEGQITIRVSINKHGAVNAVSLVKDSLKDLKIKGCVIKTVNSIMFPPPANKKDVELIQPFKFSSKAN